MIKYTNKQLFKSCITFQVEIYLGNLKKIDIYLIFYQKFFKGFWVIIIVIPKNLKFNRNGYRIF